MLELFILHWLQRAIISFSAFENCFPAPPPALGGAAKQSSTPPVSIRTTTVTVSPSRLRPLICCSIQCGSALLNGCSCDPIFTVTMTVPFISEVDQTLIHWHLIFRESRKADWQACARRGNAGLCSPFLEPENWARTKEHCTTAIPNSRCNCAPAAAAPVPCLRGCARSVPGHRFPMSRYCGRRG